MKSTKTLNAIKTSSGEDLWQDTKEIWAVKTKKKQNLKAKNAKKEFSQILAEDAGSLLRQVRTRTVHTRSSASRDALWNTQRVRPTGKFKKN